MPESSVPKILTLRIMYWNTGATHVGFELVDSQEGELSFQSDSEVSEYHGHCPWIATFKIHDKRQDSLLKDFEKLGYDAGKDSENKNNKDRWQYWGWQGWTTTLSRLSKPPFQLDQDKSPITQTNSENSLPIRRSYNPITNNCAHATLAMMQLCGVINAVPSRFSDGLFLPYRVMQLAEAARRQQSALYKAFQGLTPPHWDQHPLLPSHRDTGSFENRVVQGETSSDDLWELLTWHRNQTVFGNHDTTLEDSLLKKLITFKYRTLKEDSIKIIADYIHKLAGVLNKMCQSKTDHNPDTLNLDTQQRARIRYLYDLIFYFLNSIQKNSIEKSPKEKNPKIDYWNKVLTPKVTSTYDLLTTEDRKIIAQALSLYLNLDDNNELKYCLTSQKLVKTKSNSTPSIYPWQNNPYLAAWLALATIAPLATAGVCGTLSVHWLLSTNQAKALNDVMAMGRDHSETIQMASEDALLLLAGCLLAWAGYRILRKPDIASIGKLSSSLNPE